MAGELNNAFTVIQYAADLYEKQATDPCSGISSRLVDKLPIDDVTINLPSDDTVAPHDIIVDVPQRDIPHRDLHPHSHSQTLQSSSTSSSSSINQVRTSLI